LAVELGGGARHVALQAALAAARLARHALDDVEQLAALAVAMRERRHADKDAQPQRMPAGTELVLHDAVAQLRRQRLQRAALVVEIERQEAAIAEARDLQLGAVLRQQPAGFAEHLLELRQPELVAQDADALDFQE